MKIVTEYSVDSIYNLYHSMKFFGGYSITEIDNMSCKERDIFFFLLQNTIEEKNKARQKGKV